MSSSSKLSGSLPPTGAEGGSGLGSHTCVIGPTQYHFTVPIVWCLFSYIPAPQWHFTPAINTRSGSGTFTAGACSITLALVFLLRLGASPASSVLLVFLPVSGEAFGITPFPSHLGLLHLAHLFGFAPLVYQTCSHLSHTHASTLLVLMHFWCTTPLVHCQHF